MKTYTGSILFTLLLATLFLACEAENPVCTDSYCFIGEAFPRSELDTTRPYSEIDISEAELDIDAAAVLEALAGAKSVEPEPVDTQIADARFIPLERIIDLTARGRQFFLDKTLKTRVSVDRVFDHYLHIYVPHQDVIILLVSPDDPQRLQMMELTQTYDVVMNIYHISANPGDYITYWMWAKLEAEPVLVDQPPIEVSARDLIKDVAKGIDVYDNKYRGKVIKVRATVLEDTTVWRQTSAITLLTGRDDVVWYLYEEPDKGTFIALRNGKSYVFTMYMYIAVPPNPDEGKHYSAIQAYFQSVE